MSKTMRHIFQELNLIHLFEPFEVERIEVDTFLCLSDEEMERLGVSALREPKAFGLSWGIKRQIRSVLNQRSLQQRHQRCFLREIDLSYSETVRVNDVRVVLYKILHQTQRRAVRRQLVQKVGQQTFFVWRTKKQRLCRRLHSEKCCIKQALGQRKSNYLHRMEKLKY